jgi:hypothetical protein
MAVKVFHLKIVKVFCPFFLFFLAKREKRKAQCGNRRDRSMPFKSISCFFDGSRRISSNKKNILEWKGGKRANIKYWRWNRGLTWSGVDFFWEKLRLELRILLWG